MAQIEIYFAEELSKLTGEAKTTIYFYVSQGLLSPIKYGPNKIMVFGKDALNTLFAISNMKKQGMTLKTIKHELAGLNEPSGLPVTPTEESARRVSADEADEKVRDGDEA